MLWADISVRADNDTFVSDWHGNSGHVLCRMGATGGLEFFLRNQASTQLGGAVSPSTALSTTAGFQHVVYRWDGSNAYGFIDDTSASASASGTDLYDSGENDLFVGNSPHSSGADFITAVLNEVQIHGTDRSADWISEEYAQSNNNGTFWGTWAWTATTPATGTAGPLVNSIPLKSLVGGGLVQ